MSKKCTLLLGLITFISGTALANPDYVGTWCHRYDDFTAVLKIDSQNNALSYSVGNQAGEIVSPIRGYVSLGATRFNLILNNEDQGVVDFRVGRNLLLGVKTLKLLSEDGSVMKYVACSTKR